MALVFFAFAGYSQISLNSKTNVGVKKDKSQKISSQQKVEIWSEDFDGEVNWTFGSDVGTKAWDVADTTPNPNNFTSDITPSDGIDNPVPCPPIWRYMGLTYVNSYSESHGNFAWVDGITDLIYGSVATYNCWIRFDNINTTGYNTPKLSWIQNYKAFNYDFCYVDYSIDGGTTWTAVEVTDNNTVTTNQYANDYQEIILPAIGNQANVSIRFRWENASTDEDYGAGYGWEIDDILISETPENDLELTWGVMNFFEGVDYTDPANAAYFHYSSHYGMVANEQYANTDVDVSWFNIRVVNNGTASVTPTVNVVVTDPNGTELYNQDLVGVELATGQIDTLDVIESLSLGSAALLGTYNVTYSVFVDGVDDYTPENNTGVSSFQVSDVTMARDMNNITGSVGLCNFSSGGNDGEMLATSYLYGFETPIQSMSVYIASGTDVGTSFVGHIMQYDAGTEDWVDIGTTSLIDIAAEDIGTWKTVEFADPIYVQFETDEVSKTIRAAVEIYYNGLENFWIGYDKTVKHSIWGTQWFFTDEATWYSLTNWGLGGVGIRLYNDIIEEVVNDNTSSIVIFPNPSFGTLNIENVEGANVQIINMMGQVVENIENAQMVNTVDMSKYANGTYFVKVINGSETSTHKVNLMK